jgi:hypothetical protein
MPDNESNVKAVLTWAGGIAATVIASVAIYYFTRPPAPPATTQVGINGFVEDNITQKPVPNAIVTANLGPKLASQTTDSEGRYAFIMDSTLPPAQSINVDVLAGGYAHYSATVNLTGADTFAGVPLQPASAPVAPPAVAQPAQGQPAQGQPAAPVQPTPKPRLILHVPQNYAMRLDKAALRAK